jgi:hypothetical protein
MTTKMIAWVDGDHGYGLQAWEQDDKIVIRYEQPGDRVQHLWTVPKGIWDLFLADLQARKAAEQPR